MGGKAVGEEEREYDWGSKENTIETEEEKKEEEEEEGGTDVLMIWHHLEMYGEDNCTDRDEYHKTWDEMLGQPQIELCFYCIFKLKLMHDRHCLQLCAAKTTGGRCWFAFTLIYLTMIKNNLVIWNIAQKYINIWY